MGKVEQKINSVLQHFPGIKRGIKRAYQMVMYTVSPKLKCEGDLCRITPDDGFEYFFGYYDKSPWDQTDRYMLCMRAKNAHSQPDSMETAELLMIDTRDNSVRVLGKTNCWNVQQGCMLQWLGPDFNEKIIYNDFRNGEFCSIILNVNTLEEKLLPMPVYAVSSDGTFALTLDFTRLHRLRPGYGYCNLAEQTADEKCPDRPCIWKENLLTGECVPLLKYTDFAQFDSRPEMKNAEHKVNHLMISPNGGRFMVLHRWFVGERKYTRLLTADCNGGGLYNLLDDDFVSHCYWKNDKQILTFAEKKGEGRGYFLLDDRSKEYRHFWTKLAGDGHPSYSVHGQVVTDTYPDRRRIASVYLLGEQSEKTTVIARVFAPFRYDNDVRCDLHPRWNREGSKVCFDSTHEGKRGIYIVAVTK